MALSKPFPSIVKVLVVCCFTIPLSQQKIVRDFVKGFIYGNFVETDNERLNTSILQSLSVRNLTECEGKCLINGNCFSGNYRKNKNQHGEHDCELLADNKFTSAQLMAVENSFKHFSVASPCDQIPCRNGGTCIPVYENSSYACQCLPNAEGKHCEKVRVQWTAFWWYDANTAWPYWEDDVLKYDFGHCNSTDPYCFGRLPWSVVEDSTEMLAVDSENTTYKWRFNSSNDVAHAVWRAFHDHQLTYDQDVLNRQEWAPDVLSGNSPRRAQDSFMYREQYGIRSILLDDDNCNCYSSLSFGRGMCFDYGNYGWTGVDTLYDPFCTKPRTSVGLTLYFRSLY